MTPTRSVLVVDDYADTREMLSMALGMAGYDVFLAESGRDALDLARRHHPAAVIMDIYMPEMDGIEATRRLRAEPDLAHIPVVAHTARPQRLVEFGELFDAICAKPCPPDQLIHVLGETLQANGPRESDH
jgi:two-component system cell cycle response regulator DivK